jgi:tRNA threonylcarbamoyladenosine modification (KEOPS) complex  Pcc1 subunit
MVGLKSLETYGGIAIMLVCEAADISGFRAALNKARRSNEICVIGD